MFSYCGNIFGGAEGEASQMKSGFMVLRLNLEVHLNSLKSEIESKNT
jgi:hypothetical protein